MAYQKLLTPEAILTAAIQIIEHGEPDGLSLRAVAAALGVKAPSLYRYFQDKGKLESAVAAEVLRRMHGVLEPAAKAASAGARLMETAFAYVQFAQQHDALYFYVFQGRVQSAYASTEGKAVWNVLLDAVSNVTGKSDDTASTVALWSFLHGYVSLERAGGFGSSGPKGALALGLRSFVSQHEKPTPSKPPRKAAAAPRPRRSRQT